MPSPSAKRIPHFPICTFAHLHICTFAKQAVTGDSNLHKLRCIRARVTCDIWGRGFQNLALYTA